MLTAPTRPTPTQPEVGVAERLQVEQRTNALCFEAERVRAELSNGERMWQILVAKNLAMAALVTADGLPAIGFLTVTVGANPVAMVDQLVTMVFIWLGVGNVLLVVYPLRHEPFSARLHDGTW